jgi:HD-like signal output (HDOD) protein
MATATAQDPKELIKHALGKLTAIATLPEVTSRIISTVEDPKSSAAQLHKIVSHDPALVTRILKVVNSAFYGLPGQIASVERAIVLLGLNAVKNIAVAASLGQMFRGVKLCEGFTAKDLWSHCVAVAVVSRELARQAKLPLADEAFLAGMIHDVGILVSLQIWPEPLRAVCEKAKVSLEPFTSIETEIIGVDHQMLGKALAEKWQFPLACQLVAAHHHDPLSLTDGSRTLVGLVHIADTLCCQAAHGFPLTAAQQSISTTLVDAVGIDASIIDRTRENLTTIIQNASAFAA